MELNSRQKLLLTLDRFMCKNDSFDLRVEYPSVYGLNNERCVYLYLNSGYSDGENVNYNLTYFITILPGSDPRIEFFGRQYDEDSLRDKFLAKSLLLEESLDNGDVKYRKKQRLRLKKLREDFSYKEKKREKIDKKRFISFKNKFLSEFSKLEKILDSN